MTAAGIPRSDWPYVNCVIAGCGNVSPEGNWDGTQKFQKNVYGGLGPAYGLCQAENAPGNQEAGSKMAAAGSDWRTNPVTQLKWCHSYAQQYGGWKEAWTFRKCLGNCFSTKPGAGWQQKATTWW